MTDLFTRLFDNRHPDSFASAMRRRRFGFFKGLLAALPRPLRILDVGGVEQFWRQMGFDDAGQVEVVLLNLTEEPVTTPGMVSVAGDACAMPMFRDGEFDVVFSNSVIEHLFTLGNQQRMAEEVQRVGRRYFVQTPSRYFPLEPHFLVPGFQFFPRPLRVELVRRFNVGWYRRIPDRAAAARLVDEHRLLTAAELRALFPGANLYRERVLGLTKSFVAYKGWPQP